MQNNEIKTRSATQNKETDRHGRYKYKSETSTQSLKVRDEQNSQKTKTKGNQKTNGPAQRQTQTALTKEKTNRPSKNIRQTHYLPKNRPSQAAA